MKKLEQVLDVANALRFGSRANGELIPEPVRKRLHMALGFEEDAKISDAVIAQRLELLHGALSQINVR